MSLKFNSRVLTPLLLLNYLTAEDYIMTKAKERTNLFKGLKQNYEESVSKYAEPVDKDDQNTIVPVPEKSQVANIPKNLNDSIADSVKNVDVSHTYVAALKLAHFRQLIYNNLHDNLPVIYPLVAIGSFFAPVLMGRTCELFIYARLGFFIYDIYALKSKGEISHKSEDLIYGFSTVAIFGLLAFTSIVPAYRFASMNVSAMKASAQKELMLAQAAQKQLKNLK